MIGPPAVTVRIPHKTASGQRGNVVFDSYAEAMELIAAIAAEAWKCFGGDEPLPDDEYKLTPAGEEAAAAAAPEPEPAPPVAEVAEAVHPLDRSQLRAAMAYVAGTAPSVFRKAVAAVTAPDLGEEYWDNGEGGPLAGQDPAPELPEGRFGEAVSDEIQLPDGCPECGVRGGRHTVACNHGRRLAAMAERVTAINGKAAVPLAAVTFEDLPEPLPPEPRHARAGCGCGHDPEDHQWGTGKCSMCMPGTCTAFRAPGGGGVLLPAGCDPDALASVTRLPAVTG
jgi:hypothetical protein